MNIRKPGFVICQLGIVIAAHRVFARIKTEGRKVEDGAQCLARDTPVANGSRFYWDEACSLVGHLSQRALHCHF